MFPHVEPPHAATVQAVQQISTRKSPTASALSSAPQFSLPAEANLEFEKKRAKELLKAYRRKDAEAFLRLRENAPSFAELNEAQLAQYPMTLATAQLVIAREYGFASWARLKQQILWPPFQLVVSTMDRGDVDGVRSLLCSYPDLVRTRAPHPETEPLTYFSGALLLHHVAGNPNRGALPPNLPESAAALLQAGANPNARTLGGSTTIGLVITSMAASRAGIGPALLDVLKAAGAKDNLEDEETLLAPLRNAAPETALALWRRGQRAGLRAAAGLGQEELVRELLMARQELTSKSAVGEVHNQASRLGASALSWQDELDQALTYASSHRHVEIVGLLLQHGASINSIPKVYGNPGTALHTASDLVMARFLVEHGADLSIPDPTFGGTPLAWAEHGGHHEVARYLAEQAASRQPDSVNRATSMDPLLRHVIAVAPPEAPVPAQTLTHAKHTLFEAISLGDIEAVRQILRADTSAISARTEGTERTPLHLAADHGQLEIAKLLLASGADFYARDAHEQLPLDVAPGVEMTEVHRYLRSINKERNSFIQICIAGDVDQVRERLQQDPSLVNAKDIAEGTTPLIFASCKENPKLMELLLTSGADPDFREWSTSWNPLYFCAENGHVENLKSLLKAGADPTVVWPVNYGSTKMQMNALHLAAWKGHVEVVRLLLAAQLPVDGRARSYAQFTPLHFAATEGSLEIVRLLVEKGADPLLRDGRRSINAIEMAKAGGHQDVATYLEQMVKPQ